MKIIRIDEFDTYPDGTLFSKLNLADFTPGHLQIKATSEEHLPNEVFHSKWVLDVVTGKADYLGHLQACMSMFEGVDEGKSKEVLMAPGLPMPRMPDMLDDGAEEIYILIYEKEEIQSMIFVLTGLLQK